MAENPWDDANWSPAGQQEYLAKHGQARADARARDAKTYVGGPNPGTFVRQKKTQDAIHGIQGDPKIIPPIHPLIRRPLAEAAIIRPGSLPIYKLDDLPLPEVQDRSSG
jgi:hypothetical protein